MVLKTRDFNDGMKTKEYNFTEFEIFYSFIQKITPTYNRLKSFKSFKWDSDIIRNKFKNYFDTHNKTNLSEIQKELHCKSDKCIQIKFWTDRGWSEIEAKEKISQYQKDFSDRANEKIRLGLTERLTSNQLRWWTNKGYALEEAKKLRSERQRTFTKEKCIEKYGEKEGIRIYNNRQRKWRATIDRKYSKETQHKWMMSCKGYSNEASSLFSYFYDRLKNEHKCFLAPYTKEFLISLKDDHFYMYDFCIKDLGLIFEFNGSHVHANPNWPKEKFDNWHHAFTKENAYENVKHYKEKILAAEKLGFKVVVIWDSDLDKSKIISDEIEATLQKQLQQRHPF